MDTDFVWERLVVTAIVAVVIFILMLKNDDDLDDNPYDNSHKKGP